MDKKTALKHLYTAIYYLFFAEGVLTLHVKVARLLGSLVLGFVLSYILWVMVAMHIKLNVGLAILFPNVPVFAILLILNAISFMVSRSVRTVTFLLFASLTGQSGLSYLRACAFALVISGPIANLLANANEVARVFSCSTELTYNLTKTRFDLMAKPFTNTLQDMKEDINEIQDSFKHLEILLADLKFAVEHEEKSVENADYAKYRRFESTHFMNFSHSGNYSADESLSASKIQEKLIRGTRNNCKRQLSNGYQVCKQVFDQGFEKCATNFPDWMSNSICWPYHVDVICKVNMFANPDKVCDVSKVNEKQKRMVFQQTLPIYLTRYSLPISASIILSFWSRSGNSLRIVPTYKSASRNIMQQHRRNCVVHKRHRRPFCWTLGTIRINSI